MVLTYFVFTPNDLFVFHLHRLLFSYDKMEMCCHVFLGKKVCVLFVCSFRHLHKKPIEGKKKSNK